MAMDGPMPATLSFREPDTFFTTAWGELTYADVKGVVDQTRAHPRFGPGTFALFDGTRVDRAPTTAELRQIASDLRPLQEAGLTTIALVAGSTFTYGVARMFSVFAGAFGISISAFRSVSDAEIWLAREGHRNMRDAPAQDGALNSP